MNGRRINKTLNIFWSILLLAPLIAYFLDLYAGTTPNGNGFAGYLGYILDYVPYSEWTDRLWSALFGYDGILPMFEDSSISLRLFDYIVFWAFSRFFVDFVIWIPCVCIKLIERYFDK